MCGIVAIYHKNGLNNVDQTVINLAKKVRHRGPDDSSFLSLSNIALAHERLSIVGVESGRQQLLPLMVA